MKELFLSYDLKGYRIKNRIVMAPMEFLISETRAGLVNEGHIKHYGDRARGGVGLIIIEATSVDPQSMSVISQLGAWSDAHIPGLTRLAKECQVNGAKVLLQLQHLGVKMHEDPIGPSVYQANGIEAREMTITELHKLQDAYVSAIMRAHQAGFNGIEFHGAHGYLINQFTSPDVNRREDRYGGSLDNRMRFTQEIFERVKDKVGDNFIFSYRMGCNQHTIEDGVMMALRLEKMGIDILNVTSCGFSSYRPKLSEDFKYNWIIYGGSQIRERLQIPVIVVYEIRTPERANDILKKGYGDFTAIGRELIVDPDWANKALNDENIRYCIRCQPCVIFNGEKCVMNQQY